RDDRRQRPPCRLRRGGPCRHRDGRRHREGTPAASRHTMAHDEGSGRRHFHRLQQACRVLVLSHGGTFMRRLRSFLLVTIWISGSALAAGCGGGSGSSSVDEVDNGFESDDPNARSAGGELRAGADEAAEAPPEDADAGGQGAERIVQEADIIKVDGNRLYALS